MMDEFMKIITQGRPWADTALLLLVIYYIRQFMARVEKIEKVQIVTTDTMIEWVTKHNANHPKTEICLDRLYAAKEGKL